MTQASKDRISLQDLQAIAREVCGDPTITLLPDGTARDVPGWDSLNHTLIVIEVNADYGVDLSPYELGKAATFGALVAAIQAALDARPR